ncbi:MAG: universal stress protein, partial [Anaerolineales bacterium]
SVARQLGAEAVQAYVTEVTSKVPLAVGDQPEDLIRKAEYAEFLASTRLDKLRPEADLTVSVPGQYAKLHNLIELHEYVLEAEQNRNLTDAEVVTSWYDNEYLPIVRVIRERGMLRDFPGRTETDLYVWLAEHSAEVRAELGWQVRPTAMLTEMAEKFKPRQNRLGQLLSLVIPAGLASGPETGVWRKEKLEERYIGGLFANVLVPVSGEQIGWVGLDQALVLAQREQGDLMGLHVVRDGTAKGSQSAEAVREEFNRRCAAQQLSGTLAVEVGEVAAKICERAVLADVVVLNLAHPPGAGPLQRLSSGFRTIIRHCPRPVLAAPGQASSMHSLLLAYDGSPKSKEALFVAAYMAETWNTVLGVVTVADGNIEADALDFARKYLEFHEVKADYVRMEGDAATAILQTSEARAADLILMGGYGAHPVVEVVLGSSVDRVLRESQRAVLICQ